MGASIPALQCIGQAATKRFEAPRIDVLLAAQREYGILLPAVKWFAKVASPNGTRSTEGKSDSTSDCGNRIFSP